MKDVYIKNPSVNIPTLIYTLRKFAETDENLSMICDVLDQQQQRIDELYSIIDAMAPELDIIETMAESDEEKQEYFDKYMNHGDYLK